MSAHSKSSAEVSTLPSANDASGPSGMKVYAAINAVQAALCKVGISKSSENKQQGYKFRGIDAVYGALSPLLAEHGLCVIPRMIGRTCEERQTKSGSTLFYVNVDAEFDFVAVADGSRHTVKTYGEAMDSGDKATNKAMSAAYKYAALMTFAIPTEGDNDADSTTHDVAPKDRGLDSLLEQFAADWEVVFRDCADAAALEAEWVKCKAACMKYGDGTQAFQMVKPIYAKRYRALIPKVAA